MLSDDNLIERNAIAKAEAQVLAYLSNPTHGRTNGHLMLVCGLQKGRYSRGDSGLPESRILDRALQSLRKGQQIKCIGREWFLATER